VRTALLEHALDGDEHRDDGRLVVGAEDRPGRVADEAGLVDDRLDRGFGRNRVEVRAEEERLPRGRRLETAVEIAGVGADRGARVVLLDLEAALAEPCRDDVCDRPLPTRRAGDRSELAKK
jgi:hypothetical protein